MGSPRSLPLLLLLVLPTVAGGCLSTPTKYDPELHGPLEAGVTNTGGAGGRGSPGTGGTAGKADGPKIPVGAEGCTAQAPCTVLGQPCIVGTTICASDGTSTCGETAKLQANGSSCGVGDSVCLDGVCSACKPGSECALESQPCRRGAIDCGSGRPECIDMGNAPNGTECGQGMVCKDGTCSLCAAGIPVFLPILVTRACSNARRGQHHAATLAVPRPRGVHAELTEYVEQTACA